MILKITISACNNNKKKCSIIICGNKTDTSKRQHKNILVVSVFLPRVVNFIGPPTVTGSIKTSKIIRIFSETLDIEFYSDKRQEVLGGQNSFSSRHPSLFLTVSSSYVDDGNFQQVHGLLREPKATM